MLTAGGLLLLALFVCLAIALRVGAVGVGYSEIFREVFSRLLDAATGRHETSMSIIFDLRLPRILLAAFTGAMLAAGGAALQGLLGNPLAEPYTVGVSSGCVLGASLAVVFGLDTSGAGWTMPLAAFGTGVIAVGLVFVFARSAGRIDVNTFLLSGIIVGALFWAITTFLLTARTDDLGRVFTWFAGSFETAAPWDFLAMVDRIAIVALAGLYWFSRDLNAYALGEDAARQLGVEPERLKIWVIGLVTLGTAATVAAAGVIGFVGLIVPHAMRRIFGPDQRLLLLTSALGGACLLVLADALARGLAPPREIPVGVITAAVGAPVFLFILSRSNREGSQDPP